MRPEDFRTSLASESVSGDGLEAAQKPYAQATCCSLSRRFTILADLDHSWQIHSHVLA